MKIQWIIENIVKEPSYTELAAAVESAGHPLIKLNEDFDIEEFLDQIQQIPTIFNGSIEMTKLVRDILEYEELSGVCNPIAYCSFDKFKCSSYYSHYSKYLFNDKYALISLEGLKQNKFLYYGVFGKEALIFLRPDSGEKSFQAQLLDIIDFNKFYEQYIDLKHELVLISTPKTIIGEWRYVVGAGEIIAKSLYRYQGQTSKINAAPKEADDFVKELLKVNFMPDPVCCFDVCQDSEGKFWLLELTSFSSAGLYACDKTKIVEKVSKIIENLDVPF